MISIVDELESKYFLI